MKGLVYLNYSEMAKLITFLFFLCLKFSRHEEVSIGVSTDEITQQILHETYTLEIKDEKDDLKPTVTSEALIQQPQIPQESSAFANGELQSEYNKVILDIEKWMKKAHPNMSNYKWLKVVEKEAELKCFSSYDYDNRETEEDRLFFHRPQNSWQMGTDLYEIWGDYIQLTLDVEKLMIKTRPDMSNYKWLKVLEETLAKGTALECSSNVGSSFDFYDQNKENSQLNSKDDNDQLMKEFNRLVLFIEKWMMKINHRMRNYKWLKALETGTAAVCSDHSTNNYDYYYEYDLESFV